MVRKHQMAIDSSSLCTISVSVLRNENRPTDAIDKHHSLLKRQNKCYDNVILYKYDYQV